MAPPARHHGGEPYPRETIKDSKYGAAHYHIPLGYEAPNALWAWSAFIGMNISPWLQALTRYDKTSGRAASEKLRRELICVTARVSCHARGIVVRPSLEEANGAFGSAWACARRATRRWRAPEPPAAPGRPPRAPCGRSKNDKDPIPTNLRPRYASSTVNPNKCCLHVLLVARYLLTPM